MNDDEHGHDAAQEHGYDADNRHDAEETARATTYYRRLAPIFRAYVRRQPPHCWQISVTQPEDRCWAGRAAAPTPYATTRRAALHLAAAFAEISQYDDNPAGHGDSYD